MRILHCPKNWGGNPIGLVKAERKLGLDSKLVVFDRDAYGFTADECIDNKFVIIKEIRRWLLFLRVIILYDAVHFNAGSSIMPDLSEVNRYRSNSLASRIYYKYIQLFTLKDLPILKFFKKKIYVTYFGDDARQGDYCKTHYKYTFATEVKEGYYLKHLDDYKNHKIRVFNKFSDGIYYTNPDLMNFLPKRSKFLPYTSLFPNEYKPITKSSERVLTVVHAPSNREVKGTKYIINALRKLKEEKVNFNFQLIEKKTNKEAVDLIRKADLLIDQLLLGWYGTVAVEAMAHNVPVICYIRKSDLKYVPKQMAAEIPIIEANIDNIYSVLKDLLTSNRKTLTQIGKNSRKYVEKWHSPLKTVRKLYNLDL